MTRVFIAERMGSAYVLARGSDAEALVREGYRQVDPGTGAFILRHASRDGDGWRRLAGRELDPWGCGVGASVEVLVERVAQDVARGAPGSWVLLERRRTRPKTEHLVRGETPLADLAEEAATSSWVGLRLLDPRGEPLADQACDITLPDGSTRSLRTDAQGEVRVTDVEAGACEIEFPELDESLWEQGEAS